jgi:hypothetical protein
MMPIPTKLKANDFILTVEFSDGQIRQVDVRTFLGEGKKANEVKTSFTIFKTAFIEDDVAITWKNGFSLDPDVIYDEGMVVQSLPAIGMSERIEKHYKP